MREIALPERLVFDLLNATENYIALLESEGYADSRDEWADDLNLVRRALGIEIDGGD